MERPTFTAADPAFETRIGESFERQGVMKTLGIELAGVGPGWIDLEFDHNPALSQQHGFVHAGVLTTALDSACGYAALSLMPANAEVLTVEYKVNLLRPAQADRYRATATVTKPGRTLTVCYAEIGSASGGEAMAIMTGTLMSMVDAGLGG